MYHNLTLIYLSLYLPFSGPLHQCGDSPGLKVEWAVPSHWVPSSRDGGRGMPSCLDVAEQRRGAKGLSLSSPEFESILVPVKQQPSVFAVNVKG